MLKTTRNLSYFLEVIRKNSSKIALEDLALNKKISFETFLKKSQLFALYLKKKKLKKGDKVIIKLENSLNYPIAVFGCMLGGYTACPIDINIPQIKYKTLKNILNPKIEIKNFKFNKSTNLRKFQTIKENFISIIMFTSGTTGEPKGIQISLESYLGMARSFSKLCGYEENTKIYNCLPLHYNAGLLNTCFAGLINGSKVIIGPKVNSLNILSLTNNLKNLGVNSIHLTPEIADAITKIKHNNEEKDTIFKIEKIISTGGYLHESTKNKFEKVFKKRLLNCYGVTELGGPITLQNWEDSFEEYSVGQISEDIKIKINKSNKLNHILVKSPYIFENYILSKNKFQIPKLNKKYFDTGDVGFVKNNQLYITGRRKDIFKKGSEIISSQNLENVCGQFSSVLDCAVIIKDDVAKGSKIYFFIIFKEIKDIEQNIINLRKYLLKNLKKIELPDKIIPVPFISKTVTGKIKKFILEDIYL